VGETQKATNRATGGGTRNDGRDGCCFGLTCGAFWVRIARMKVLAEVLFGWNNWAVMETM